MPLWGGGAASPSNTMSPEPRTTSVPSGILIHPAVWPQQTWAENWSVPLWGKGELGPHLTVCGQGRGLPPCQVSSWSIQPFGHNRHGPKIGGGQLCWPFLCGGDGSPSNTMCPGLRPISEPNGILIHPAIWPQETWAADYMDAGKACACKFRKWGAAVPISVGWAGVPI